MQVFISYCREDISYLKRLLKTLKGYGPSVSDTCWSDQSLQPSELWMASLQAALQSAQVALLLVTPDFLASDFIRQHELPTLLQRAEAKTLRLIPVPVRAVDWASQPFQRYMSAWDPEHPLAKQTVPEQDESYVLLGRLIRTSLSWLSPPTGDQTDGPAHILPDWFHLPHERNPLFVGRTEELAELHHALYQSGKSAITPKAAAMGLGGMGKTQLAVEYAYRYAPHYPGGVFWFNCEQVDGILGQIAACGVTMDLFSEDDPQPQAAKVKRVQKHWHEDRCLRLLIYDNCEDEAVLKRWPVRDPHLHLLVTSRRSWSAGWGFKALALQTLTRPDSIALLQAHRADLSRDDADRIATVLGDLPLALHLAACYLETYGVTVSPSAYLAALDRDLLAHPSLLGAGSGDCQPTDHDRHVARTFATSYDRLDASQAADALAQELLLRASFLAPGAPFKAQHLIPDDADIQLHADAMARLVQLGLLQREGQALVLHRLLAHFCRSLHSAERCSQAEAQVIDRVRDLTKAANATGLPAKMAPHLAHLRHLAEGQASVPSAASAYLSNELGYHLNLIGAYGETERWYRLSLACAEQVLGGKHPETAIRLNNLAELLRVTQRLTEAEPLFRRALAIDEAALGPDHPQVAIYLNNLAELFRAIKRLVEAEPLYRRALAINEAALGPDHPNVATYLNNLAELLSDTQRLAEAEPLYRRALAIGEAALGPDHPKVAIRLNNLAGLLRATQRLAEAEPLFRRAVAIFQAELGAEHPHTQTFLKNWQITQAELAQNQPPGADA